MELSQFGINEWQAQLRPVHLKRKFQSNTQNYRNFLEYVAKESVRLQHKALERALRQLVMFGVPPEEITVRYVGDSRSGDIQVSGVVLFTFSGVDSVSGYEISVLPTPPAKKEVLPV